MLGARIRDVMREVDGLRQSATRRFPLGSPERLNGLSQGASAAPRPTRLDQVQSGQSHQPGVRGAAAPLHDCVVVQTALTGMVRRRHGFDNLNGASAPSKHQTIAAAAFFTLIVGAAFFELPCLPTRTALVIISTLYGVLACTVAGLDILCTLTDPADEGAVNPAEFPANDSGEDVLYCARCDLHVSSRSKHCRVCDKCVSGFDHHCNWLNTCIGEKNYKLFFALLCSTIGLICTQVCLSAYLIWRAVAEREALERDLRASYSLANTDLRWDGFVGLVVGFAAIALLLCYVVGELLMFHVILIIKGISTYDYILIKRRQEEAKNTSIAAGEAPASQACFCIPCGQRAGTVAPTPMAETPRATNGAKKPPIKVSIDPCALLRVRSQQASKAQARGADMRRLMTQIAREDTPGSTPDATPTKPQHVNVDIPAGNDASRQ